MDVDVRVGDQKKQDGVDLSRTIMEPESALCDICGAPMLDVHCKLVCRRCGFMRDCSDP